MRRGRGKARESCQVRFGRGCGRKKTSPHAASVRALVSSRAYLFFPAFFFAFFFGLAFFAFFFAFFFGLAFLFMTFLFAFLLAFFLGLAAFLRFLAIPVPPIKQGYAWKFSRHCGGIKCVLIAASQLVRKLFKCPFRFLYRYKLRTRFNANRLPEKFSCHRKRTTIAIKNDESSPQKQSDIP